jgi:hypothetical protein
MTADELFWRLASELQAEDPRIVEGTIMNGSVPPCGQGVPGPRRLQRVGLGREAAQDPRHRARRERLRAGVCACRTHLQGVGLGAEARPSPLARAAAGGHRLRCVRAGEMARGRSAAQERRPLPSTATSPGRWKAIPSRRSCRRQWSSYRSTMSGKSCTNTSLRWSLCQAQTCHRQGSQKSLP